MLKSQKLQLELSELRQKINALNGEDDLADEQRAELDAATKRHTDAEIEFRAAVVAESTADAEAKAEAEAGANGDGEQAELRALVADARCGNYLAAAVEHRALDGREAELNAHLGLAGNVVPFECLETRADATTTAPATTSTQQHPILARVFARTSAAFLGVDMPMVATGEANYPVFTTGVDGEQVDEGGTTDAVAAVFTPNTVLPKRLQARYRFSVEGAATMQGMETALRQDLANALGEALDKRTIADNLLGTAGLTNPADPTAKVTWATAKAAMVEQVDGRYAQGTGELRCVVGAPTYKLLSTLYLATGQGQTEEDANAMLMRILGGYRVSAHIPAATSDVQAAVVALGSHRAAVCPIWQGVRLIRDELTRANEGEVVLTAVMLQGFAMIRQAAMKRVEFKIA